MDNSGQAYLTGFTKSTNFPLADPFQAEKGGDGCSNPPCADAFVSMVDASGSALVYSTYLGGDGSDYGADIALDVEGSAYLTGYTLSGDFPTTPGAYDLTYGGNAKSDAFVTKVSAPAPPPPSSLQYNWHYEYDGLYRLAYACPDWDSQTSTCLGDAFTYSYDAVGNRLSETVGAETTNYVYDIANRLTAVNGVNYTWDDNGNLLSDGVNTYTYDHANHLTSVVGSSMTSSYAYNGLGDRLQQTVDSVTTNYDLDLNNWLTQVLADGTQTYLYGTGRIAQYNAIEAQYFLGDALGSVRQLADGSGEVELTRTFQPYGESMAGMGEVVTNYGFTGEWQDPTGLLYLRARYYAPQTGRFITRDTWEGVETRPMSFNAWLYGYSNPLLYMDRSGHSPTVECDKILLPDLRSLCKVANGDDNDPNVVDARYQFFWKISKYSKLLTIFNSGFWWAGDMLQYFLLKSGDRDVILPIGTSFARDPGIARAIKEKMPHKYNDEPKEITPLLYVFLSRLETQIDCGNYQGPLQQTVGSGETYVDRYDPRPHGLGWWGAFGHVRVDAEYSNIIAFPTFSNDAYVVKTQVRYSVDEKYEWFGGAKSTPLPLGTLNWDADIFPPVHLVYIPHDWEDSLVSHNLASEYDYNLSWSEYMQIVVLEDFSYFLLVGEGKWLPLE